MTFVEKIRSAQYPFTGVPVIVCFGDSVTHGAFEAGEFDFEAVYHERLRKMLIKENPWLPVNVINAGIAGDCAHAALPRLQKDVIDHHPDICIVNFCLNDTNNPLDEYIADMREIITKIKAAGIPVILLTSNMMNTSVIPEETEPRFLEYAKLTANMQNCGHVDKYVNAARALAKELDVPVADAYAKWEAMRDRGENITLCLANRINHPKRELHQLFADALYEVLSTVDLV